ncbi:PF09998 family protein [Neorhizobium galegae bv. orientalis]|nr:PF09998 family protein [Neorhizobium galegae bv. orientalis]
MADFHWTAFRGENRIAGGSPAQVVKAIKAGGHESVLVFDDTTGKPVDLDLRGTLEDCLGRLPKDDVEAVAPVERRPGRPKLGVVPREVTLLPRHWEWLGRQPGGASVALRKLVDAARAASSSGDDRRRAQEAADRFMQALGGDQPGYEDATRALYAGQEDRFKELTESWPKDVRDHARYLARAAFGAGSAEEK